MKNVACKLVLVSVLLLIRADLFLAEQPSKLRDPNIPFAPGEVPDPIPAPRKIAPVDYYAPVTDDPALPRALLMGESVSIAYSPTVRRELAEIADIQRSPANCGATKTALGHCGLNRWLKDGEKWAVIVFNHGLHEPQTPPSAS
jgi:hypothetical protein